MRETPPIDRELVDELDADAAAMYSRPEEIDALPPRGGERLRLGERVRAWLSRMW